MIAMTHSNFFSKPLTVVLLAGVALQGQTAKIINVNEPRPLWSAFDRLEVEHPGVAINYEDPPYENPADVQDSATPEQQAARPGFHLIVPRSGRVSATIQRTSSTVAGSPADVIFDVNLLLASYRQNALPGDFNVEQANGLFYVTPTTVLGANGAPRAVNSPMTIPVTLSYARRTVADTVQMIFNAISEATGLRIGIAAFPFRPNEEVSFGASNETARDALARLFSLAAKTPISYRLLFDPKLDSRRVYDYIVNIHRAGFTAPQVSDIGVTNSGSAVSPVTPPVFTGSSPGMVPVKK